MRFDRLTLMLLIALAVTRLLPNEPMLTNALVLPFMIPVTLCLKAAAFANRHSTAFGSDSVEVGRQLPKAA